MYGLIADAIAILHLAFVIFVVFGVLVVMRWHRIAWLHIPSVLWAAFVETTGGYCPLTPLEKEYRLLAGETLNEEGEYYTFNEVKLAHPAPGLDVLGAVVGPNSTDLCAEISDGIVLSVLAGPKYVESVRQKVGTIRSAKGLAPDFDVVTYVLASVGDDKAEVCADLRGVAAFYLDAMGATAMTGVYGVNDQLQQMIDQGGADAIAENMPDDWMDWLTIGGTPADCISSIQNLFDAGTSSIVLCLMPTSDIDTQIKRFSETVLPNI